MQAGIWAPLPNVGSHSRRRRREADDHSDGTRRGKQSRRAGEPVEPGTEWELSGSQSLGAEG